MEFGSPDFWVVHMCKPCPGPIREVCLAMDGRKTNRSERLWGQFIRYNFGDRKFATHVGLNCGKGKKVSKLRS